MPTDFVGRLRPEDFSARGDSSYLARLIADEMGWSESDPLHRRFLRIAAKALDAYAAQETAVLRAKVERLTQQVDSRMRRQSREWGRV